MKRLFRSMTLIERLLLVSIVIAATVWVIQWLQPAPTPVERNQIIVVPDDEGETYPVSNLT